MWILRQRCWQARIVKNQSLLLLLWVLFVHVPQVSTAIPEITCPKYVEEGTVLDCDCIAPADVTGTASLTWPGHSVTSRLTLVDIRKEQNGTDYTCQMVANGATTTVVVYTMQVAYGPEGVSIAGVDQFPTNGTGILTLTCQAEQVNPEPRYTWSGIICTNGNTGRTCTFQPQPIRDEGKRVACLVTSAFVGGSVKSAQTIYILNMLYPPSTVPVVTTVSSASYLRTGDVIKCSVSGGKPAVTSVTFTCSNPDLQDETDVIANDALTGVTSVTSSVQIRSSRGRSQFISCLCSATWSPDESMYPSTTTRLLPIEYAASVTNFTANNVPTSLTVTENDVTSVQLTCSANGLPSPNITLSRMTALEVLSQQTGVLQSSLTLSDLSCKQSGVYVCSVNNGISRTDQQVFRLNVLCGPKAFNDSMRSQNQNSPPSLTLQGLEFTVQANPAPTIFSYTPINTTSTNNNAVFRPRQMTELFTTSCRQAKDVDYLATCRVRPKQVTSQELGVYSVDVINSLGRYTFYFKVQEALSTDPREQPSSDNSKAVPVVAVLGGVIGVLVIVVVVVAICCIARRGRQMGTETGPQQKANEDEFEEHINEGYVSADAIDVNMGDTKASGMPSSSTHDYDNVANELKGAFFRARSNTAGSRKDGGGEVKKSAEDENGQGTRVPKVTFNGETGSQKHISVLNIKMENSPRNSPRDSPRYNAFSVETSRGQSSPGPHRSPRNPQILSDYAEIGGVSPRRQKNQKNVYAVSDSKVAPAPQGSVRGPLGDIYSLVSRSPKIGQGRASDRSEGVNGQPGNLSPRARDDARLEELRVGDADVHLPEKTDRLKPARRQKPHHINHQSNPGDVNQDTMFPKEEPSSITTDL